MILRATRADNGLGSLQTELVMTSEKQPSTWYSVTLLFESSVSGTLAVRPLCEERIILLLSTSEADSRRCATQYGKSEEHQYLNQAGDRVRWLFRSVEKVEEVELPADGLWIVASRFVRRQSKPRSHRGRRG